MIKRVMAVVLGSVAMGAAILGLMSVLAGFPPTGKFVARMLCVALGSLVLGYVGFRGVRYGFGSRSTLPAR